MWEMPIGPVGRLLQYTDGESHWVNCPLNEAWVAVWNSLKIASAIMESEQQWRQCFCGSSIRRLPPEQRLSIHLGQIASHLAADNFVWLSADATLQLVGIFFLPGGETKEFPRSDTSDVAPLIHRITLEPCRIGECELVASMWAVIQRSRKGDGTYCYAQITEMHYPGRRRPNLTPLHPVGFYELPTCSVYITR